MLIGKKLSTAQLYTKALPALIAFSFSPFLFFNPFDASDNPFSYIIRETYSDVELQHKRLISEEDSIYSLAQIPYIALTKEGDPFSGVENIYSKKTDILMSSNVFVDGLSVHLKVFDEDGAERATVDTFYNAYKTKKTSTRYYQSGTLRNELIFSSPYHNGKRVFKFWDSDGHLQTVLISGSDQTGTEFSELINYDPEGNVIFHERRENDELVEKIK
ncbi:MAG: hypothetical protein ED557_10350 [Balneola sp.]|nr:MAG: hypothetical protein ED557_10350 [Balneola sp.]